MNKIVFEDLFAAVQINTVVNLEYRHTTDNVQAILVKTKHGDSYKIAVIRYKPDSACATSKCFEAHAAGLVISTKQYAAAIPWDEIAALYTEAVKN
ncbi:MAG: hypothetical protein J6J71_02745 [Prevotella sp.]|nr:hypothetical protein [Paludibacteraceae bacterium]MBP3573507.1 hypothetical protein [Prevotella sp.]